MKKIFLLLSLIVSLIAHAQTEKFAFYADSASSYVNLSPKINIKHYGDELWCISSSGGQLIRYNTRTGLSKAWHFQISYLRVPAVYDLEIDSLGTKWLLCDSGFISFNDSVFKTHRFRPPYLPYAPLTYSTRHMVQGPRGAVYAAWGDTLYSLLGDSVKKLDYLNGMDHGNIFYDKGLDSFYIECGSSHKLYTKKGLQPAVSYTGTDHPIQVYYGTVNYNPEENYFRDTKGNFWCSDGTRLYWGLPTSRYRTFTRAIYYTNIFEEDSNHIWFQGSDYSLTMFNYLDSSFTTIPLSFQVAGVTCIDHKFYGYSYCPGEINISSGTFIPFHVPHVDLPFLPGKITIDSFDNKWMICEAGIVRWDSLNNFNLYNSTNSVLPSMLYYPFPAFSLTTDRANNIICMGGTALYIYHSATGHWTLDTPTISHQWDFAPSAITIDSRNNLYVATGQQELFRLDSARTHWYLYNSATSPDFISTSGEAIDGVFATGGGQVYASGRMNYYHLNGNVWNKLGQIGLPNGIAQNGTFVWPRDTGLIFAYSMNPINSGHYGGLRYDTTLTFGSISLRHTVRTDINFYADIYKPVIVGQDLWLKTSYGLAKYSYNGNYSNLYHYSRTLYEPSNSPFGTVADLCPDKHGNIWICTSYGLIVYNENGISGYPDPYRVHPVWPGDADNNGIVDQNDLLPIGQHYGDSGYSRNSVSIVWSAQDCIDWIDTATLNKKYADCNGNGIINDDDTLAVSANFSLTHSKRENTLDQRAGGLKLKLVLDSTVYYSTTIKAGLYLGDSVTVCPNAYGLAYALSLPSSISPVSLSYTNSWFAPTGNKLSMLKADAASIRSAITRKDHTNVSGSGKIADLTFTISNTVANGSYVSFPFTAIRLQNFNGTQIPISPEYDSVRVYNNPSGINEIKAADLTIYPNPSTGIFTFSRDMTGSASRVYNDLGALIYDRPISRNTIDLSVLSSGLYLLEVESGSGQWLRRKIQIMK